MYVYIKVSILIITIIMALAAGTLAGTCYSIWKEEKEMMKNVEITYRGGGIYIDSLTPKRGRRPIYINKSNTEIPESIQTQLSYSKITIKKE